MDEHQGKIPFAWLEDPEELKRQYCSFDTRTLRRWAQAVVGPHREAMLAVLRERGENAN